MKNPKAIAAFISDNAKLFKPGTIFSDVIINDAFNIQEPSTKGDTASVARAFGAYAFKKGHAQAAINKVLATQGLYLKQFKYTNYKVLSKTETLAHIDSRVARASASIASATRLESAVLSSKTPKWKKPTASQFRLLAAIPRG